MTHTVTTTLNISESPLTVILSAGETDNSVDFSFQAPTEVTLDYFRAQGIEGAIVVEWSMSDEESCEGFNLWRSLHPSQEQALVADESIAPMGVGYIYRITDTEVVPWRTYWYQLEILLEGGGSTRSGFTAAQPQAEISHFVYLPVVQEAPLGIHREAQHSRCLIGRLIDCV